MKIIEQKWKTFSVNIRHLLCETSIVSSRLRSISPKEIFRSTPLCYDFFSRCVPNTIGELLAIIHRAIHNNVPKILSQCRELVHLKVKSAVSGHGHGVQC